MGLACDPDGGSGRLGQLLARGDDLASIGTAVREGLSSYCQFDHACLGTIDPATHMVTSHYQVGDRLADLSRVLENEYTEPDIDKFSVLSRAPVPVGTLVESTSGEPQRSPRYREIHRPLGYSDEARVALVAGGTLWGFLSLCRREGSPSFSPVEKVILHNASAMLGEAARRLAVTKTGCGRTEPGEEAELTGMLVVDDDGRALSASPQGARFIERLSSGLALPPVIDMVVTAARAAPDGESPVARVRCISGLWLTVSATRLSGPSGQQFVVLLRRSQPAELAPLMFQAYGLTQREVEVADAVWKHLSTEEIAARLFISGYTVQDHLKSVFRKMGVRSRRELLAKILAEVVTDLPLGRG